ncbi:SPOR domain-containing protein [Sphingomonas xinjiangensis]|uniref:Flp pilus assembly protein TadD n=1 Tax=Sphingomonas xinjiangensis TaxID=643568 RepID=A0A840YLY8_9SPHN|nr:SPOR domain-containing protein [Sphingomonas xinjiangensis]MBB5710636.1 Flp pilus assembly protein TadD [Sphingomonas xinjiangensis]
MTRIFLMHSAALAMAIIAGVGPAFAQTVMVATPNPDADRLAQTVRALATDPRNLSELVEAGRLSTRLNDLSAALAFFQRAESVSPSDPRIAAGRASVLVRMKRPGEALRLFQSAEARGVAIRDYAADRGFAYDLLGQPGLAQADYKIALQRERDDELVRRYALSLGISGQVSEANSLLDPLLRRSDRAAWRARAFILAMNGDVGGADKIASSMMPGNMAQPLAPFFRRLPTLAPADRAFAVHFGELSPTQARLADAAMAPVLPRYGASQGPVQVAAVRQVPAPAGSNRDRRSARDQRTTRARRPQAPVAVAAVAPMPTPRTPAPTASSAPQPIVQQPAPRPVLAQSRPLVQPIPTSPPVSGSAAPTHSSLSQGAVTTAAAPVQAARPVPTPAPPPTLPAGAAAPARFPVTPGEPAPAVSNVPAASRPAPAGSVPVTASAAAPATSAPTAASVQPVAAAPEQPQSQPIVTPAAPAAPADVRVAAARSEPTPPGPVAVGEEDSVLASIVANLTIPAAELEAVNSTAVPVPAPEPEPVRAAAAPAPEPEPAPVRPAPARKGEAKEPSAAKSDKVVKGDRTPKAEKGGKAAKADKAADAKAKPAAKPDPERVWVQVASGANTNDLAKAWKSLAGKARAEFKGKAGWWTPVRASNRLLTGPFKTEAEGQAFVNTLSKAGVSSFVFTSEAGQKINKITGK